MALVHDLAESIVGDITPHQGITKPEKYRMELVSWRYAHVACIALLLYLQEAMEHIRSLVPEEVVKW